MAKDIDVTFRAEAKIAELLDIKRRVDEMVARISSDLKRDKEWPLIMRPE